MNREDRPEKLRRAVKPKAKGRDIKLFVIAIVAGTLVGLLLRSLAEPDAPSWALPVTLVAGAVIIGGVVYAKRRSK